jgi:hypothetical protein
MITQIKKKINIGIDFHFCRFSRKNKTEAFEEKLCNIQKSTFSIFFIFSQVIRFLQIFQVIQISLSFPPKIQKKLDGNPQNTGSKIF